MALHRVLAMSRAYLGRQYLIRRYIVCKNMVGLCALALALSATHAYAQNVQRPLTIADCPRGYTLGVQDTDAPQFAARLPNTNAGANSGYGTAVSGTQASGGITPQVGDPGTDANAAPRQFITGCIPPTTLRNPD